MIDVDVVARFLEILTGAADTPVTWQTFDDAKKKGRRGRAELTRILHGPVTEHIEELERLSNAGAGIFITVNETDGKGREAKNVRGLRALFVDKDDGPLPLTIVPPPSMRVLREGHGEHAYWVLRKGEDLSRFRAAQKRLIGHFDSDSAIHDLPRVMRVPGFPHQKDPSKPQDLVLLAPPDPRVDYTLDELLAAFPPGGRRGVERLAARIAELRLIQPGETAHDALLAVTTELAALEREGLLGPGWVEEYLAVVTKEWAEPMDREQALSFVTTAVERAKASTGLVGLVMGETGPLTTIGNVTVYLTQHPLWEGTLGWNAFTEKVVWTRQPDDMPPVELGSELVEHQVSDIQQSLARLTHKKFSKEDVLLGAISAAHKKPFHPVQEYLAGVEWDGVPRLDTWLSRYAGTEDSDYTRKVGRWFLISAVARAMEPGCKVDYMLLLVGEQGAKKSTLVSTLSGGRWFRDGITDVREKQAELDLAGYWLIEVAELDAFSRAEQTSIKAFLTRRSSQVRPPYGRVTVERPRQCVFVGTTNNEEPLTDPTGNRRFWPVKVSTADLASLERDRDQLWAEAARAWASGETWYPADEDYGILKERQEALLYTDAWEDTLRSWWESMLKSGPRRGGIINGIGDPPYATAALLQHVLGVESARQDRSAQMRLGAALRHLGWYKVRPDPRAPRVWTHPSLPTYFARQKVGSEN